MRKLNALISIIIAGIMFLCGCSGAMLTTTEIMRLPISDLNDIISEEYVEFDPSISADGNGSIKIDCDEPIVVELYVLKGIDIDDAKLVYEAKLRSAELKGLAYLEMYCCFDGLGEYFSRDLKSPISGTSSWRHKETPFFLQKGQIPDRIKLNLVVNGTGVVWIDDIRLTKAPLG